MELFEEYLRQGEPNKVEKANDWKTAIGLPQVDGLQPSDYLVDTARQNIEGTITFAEVKRRIDSYYEQHPIVNEALRTEEADKVSARIAEILSEKTFSFSPAEYLTIHRRLFQGLFLHAGKIRDYNITKKEWVLNGETVLYASAESIMATLEYDFKQEKTFNYHGLSQQAIIEHLAHFIANVWQIHPFGEGNTRSTAVFLIKYLRKLGFAKVTINLFAEHAWYFRNALVRANYEDLSKGIHKTDRFLIRFFENLFQLGGGVLKNREMHVEYRFSADDTVNDTVKRDVDAVLDLIKQNNTLTAVDISQQLHISLSTAKRRMKALKEKGLLDRVGSDKTGTWKIL